MSTGLAQVTVKPIRLAMRSSTRDEKVVSSSRTCPAAPPARPPATPSRARSGGVRTAARHRVGARRGGGRGVGKNRGVERRGGEETIEFYTLFFSSVVAAYLGSTKVDCFAQDSQQVDIQHLQIQKSHFARA